MKKIAARLSTILLATIAALILAACGATVDTGTKTGLTTAECAAEFAAWCEEHGGPPVEETDGGCSLCRDPYRTRCCAAAAPDGGQ